MSGDWLTLGVVGFLALASTLRGSANRRPDKRVRSVLLMHPSGGDVIAYLDAPGLDLWRQVRVLHILDALGASRTIWEIVVEYGWWEETWGRGASIGDWQKKNPKAYLDKDRCYPPPVVVEKAILRALGLPAFVEAGSEEPMCGNEVEPSPQAPPAEQFHGPSLVLHKGRTTQGEVFWASKTPEVGLSVMVLCKKEDKGLCFVWVIEQGEPRLLVSRVSPHTLVMRPTGGRGVIAAVEDAYRRHNLDLELSEAHHWDSKQRLTQGALS